MIQVMDFRGCVQSISSIFGGYHLLLVAAWSVFRVLSCWWSQAIGSEVFFWQVLVNVLIFFSVAAVVLHVSAPHSRTGFTVVILMLTLMVRLSETQVFFIWRKAALALPIFTLKFYISISPPCLSTMIPK